MKNCYPVNDNFHNIKKISQAPLNLMGWMRFNFDFEGTFHTNIYNFIFISLDKNQLLKKSKW